MPYENEFAGYRPLHRIVECERVKQLLQRARIFQPADGDDAITPVTAPVEPGILPKFVVAIDGSRAEVQVDEEVKYPGARIGYCTVASVLIDLDLVERLDANRPVDPQLFRKTEKASSIDAALPGSNIVTRRQNSARSAFREELYDHFQAIIIDEEDKTPLIDTYEILLALKPGTHSQRCPYFEDDGCEHEFRKIPDGVSHCPSCQRPVYSTDALRIHERFNPLGTNEEAFTYVMQVWEKLLLIHLLRILERRSLFQHVHNLAFFLDGPLAVFGPPAWLSAALSRELKRLNAEARLLTGNDIIVLGIEKTGEFASHFDEIDRGLTPGKPFFEPRQYLMPKDSYIKERIQQSASQKRFGMDTYFGRKFFYKTKGGARIVANIPFLTEAQDRLDTDDVSLFPRFSADCALLDRLVSSRYPNALSPLISAHAEASIPLNLGAKVLQQLAQALIGER